MTAAISYLEQLNVLQPEQMAKVIQLIYPAIRRELTKEQKLEIIKQTVSQSMGISFDDMFIKRRFINTVQARHLVYYFCWLFKAATLKEIGSFVNGKPQDHTTVIHAKNKILGYLDVDVDFRNMVEEIEFKIHQQFSNLLNQTNEPTI